MDIVCLQETHSDKDSISDWGNEWGGAGKLLPAMGLLIVEVYVFY